MYSSNGQKISEILYIIMNKNRSQWGPRNHYNHLCEICLDHNPRNKNNLIEQHKW